MARARRRTPATARDEVQLAADIVALATIYGRYAYRRATVLLRQTGWAVHRKRSSGSGGARG